MPKRKEVRDIFSWVVISRLRNGWDSIEKRSHYQPSSTIVFHSYRFNSRFVTVLSLFWRPNRARHRLIRGEMLPCICHTFSINLSYFCHFSATAL
ncbi:Uncharacterised protein [Vibrio cholerae]|uniref:Uncharacterized protein n=1 Tax=Vibrio cholerae TaxID=666 RepID=A0A655WUU9_VIBCL|nr:Uncharacterised protein [Vibrio cholerae]CSC24556.1 Uncharacterised protein [Vibrio cholerae]CSH98779.1 Uncharacterised protein [Vibrio cholerae]